MWCWVHLGVVGGAGWCILLLLAWLTIFFWLDIMKSMIPMKSMKSMKHEIRNMKQRLKPHHDTFGQSCHRRFIGCHLGHHVSCRRHRLYRLAHGTAGKIRPPLRVAQLSVARKPNKLIRNNNSFLFDAACFVYRKEWLRPVFTAGPK